MAKVKYDGVVETVHYQPDGKVSWVRAYLRRGPIFSDVLILDRPTLVEHLKAGKRYMVGRRIPQLAGTFEVTEPLKVLDKNGQDVLATGDNQVEQDRLEGVPII